MNGHEEHGIDAKTEAAIEDLRRRIVSQYPTATFEVSRNVDEPRNVHLTAIVDLDEPGDVLDLVIDRVVELQVDEGIPVHVIPVRTPERILAAMAARAQGVPQTASR